MRRTLSVPWASRTGLLRRRIPRHVCGLSLSISQSGLSEKENWAEPPLTVPREVHQPYSLSPLSPCHQPCRPSGTVIPGGGRAPWLQSSRAGYPPYRPGRYGSGTGRGEADSSPAWTARSPQPAWEPVPEAGASVDLYGGFPEPPWADALEGPTGSLPAGQPHRVSRLLAPITGRCQVSVLLCPAARLAGSSSPWSHAQAYTNPLWVPDPRSSPSSAPVSTRVQKALPVPAPYGSHWPPALARTGQECSLCGACPLSSLLCDSK